MMAKRISIDSTSASTIRLVLPRPRTVTVCFRAT